MTLKCTRKGEQMMTKRKAHNAVLKSTAYFMGAVFIVSGCLLDSDSWIPVTSLAVSALWLAVFAYANGMMSDYEEGDD